MPDLSIKAGTQHFLVSFSRYARFIYFNNNLIVPLQSGYEQDGQALYVEIQTIVKNMTLVILFCAGTFSDIENSANLKTIFKKSDGTKIMVMKSGDPMNILDSIYFVIVTLLTVGYGDIMPTTVPG